MLLNVRLELLGVEFAPMTPTNFGSQSPRLRGVQIAVNGAPTEIKTPGGFGFGAARLNESDHPFSQIQCIGFHAHKPIRLCANFNVNCYIAFEHFPHDQFHQTLCAVQQDCMGSNIISLCQVCPVGTDHSLCLNCCRRSTCSRRRGEKEEVQTGSRERSAAAGGAVGFLAVRRLINHLITAPSSKS